MSSEEGEKKKRSGKELWDVAKKVSKQASVSKAFSSKKYGKIEKEKPIQEVQRQNRTNFLSQSSNSGNRNNENNRKEREKEIERERIRLKEEQKRKEEKKHEEEMMKLGNELKKISHEHINFNSEREHFEGLKKLLVLINKNNSNEKIKEKILNKISSYIYSNIDITKINDLEYLKRELKKLTELNENEYIKQKRMVKNLKRNLETEENDYEKIMVLKLLEKQKFELYKKIIKTFENILNIPVIEEPISRRVEIVRPQIPVPVELEKSFKRMQKIKPLNFALSLPSLTENKKQRTEQHLKLNKLMSNMQDNFSSLKKPGRRVEVVLPRVENIYNPSENITSLMLKSVPRVKKIEKKNININGLNLSEDEKFVLNNFLLENRIRNSNFLNNLDVNSNNSNINRYIKLIVQDLQNMNSNLENIGLQRDNLEKIQNMISTELSKVKIDESKIKLIIKLEKKEDDEEFQDDLQFLFQFLKENLSDLKTSGKTRQEKEEIKENINEMINGFIEKHDFEDFVDNILKKGKNTIHNVKESKLYKNIIFIKDTILPLKKRKISAQSGTNYLIHSRNKNNDNINQNLKDLKEILEIFTDELKDYLKTRFSRMNPHNFDSRYNGFEYNYKKYKKERNRNNIIYPEYKSRNNNRTSVKENVTSFTKESPNLSHLYNKTTKNFLRELEKRKGIKGENTTFNLYKRQKNPKSRSTTTTPPRRAPRSSAMNYAKIAKRIVNLFRRARKI